MKTHQIQSMDNKPIPKKTILDSLTQTISSALTTKLPVNPLSFIISDYVKPQNINWAAEVMRRSNMTLSEKAELIAITCGDALDEDILNRVSHALEILTDREKQLLFAEWSKPSSPLLHKGLYLYFSPLDLWHITRRDVLWNRLKDQLKNSHLPKHLYPVLIIKSLVVENKWAEAIGFFRNSKKRIMHLHLSNYFSDVEQYKAELKRHKVFAPNNYSPFWEADFSRLNLMGANFSRANFYRVNLVNANLTQAYLVAAEFDVSTQAENSNFSYANLSGSSIKGNFKGSNFARGNFYKTVFACEYSFNGHHISINFENAKFDYVDFSTIQYQSLPGFATQGDLGKVFIKFSGQGLANSHLQGAPFAFLQSLPSDVVRAYFYKIAKQNPSLNPFVDYFENWKQSNFLNRLFMDLIKVAPPHDEYCAVLCLLSPVIKVDHDLIKFLASLRQENKPFILAQEKFALLKAQAKVVAKPLSQVSLLSNKPVLKDQKTETVHNPRITTASGITANFRK